MGRVRYCREGADPGPSLRRPTRGTACPNRRGPAGRREAPASLLPMLGVPAGRSPAPPAPPLADRAAALAAGGGLRALLLPLLSSGGAKRRLHPPAAFPGQSRRRGPRARSDSRGSSRLASAEAAAAGGPSPARTDGGFPKPRSFPQQGWDLPVCPGRPLQPGAPAEPRSPPPAAPFDNRRSRTRHRKLRWRPHRGREGARSWNPGGEKSRENPSFSLPRPLRVPSHYPAPQLVPGAVTSGLRSRAPPASRCSRLKRKESGRAAATPSP